MEENTLQEFEQYLKKQGTQHELTVLKTPQQNEVAERMNRTLVETIMLMLADSELTKRFWAEALSALTYLRNRSPTNALQDKTAYEAWNGNRPNVSHLRIFGCDAYDHVPKDERCKFDSKTRRSIFLGYGQGVKGYRLYDKAQKRIFYSRNVVFNETRSKQDDVNDVTENESSIELEMEFQREDDNTIKHHADEEPQQERRERLPPNRYGEWIYIGQEENPVTVKEALPSQDAAKWREAMETELQSLHKNQVWELSELTPGKKTI